MDPPRLRDVITEKQYEQLMKEGYHIETVTDLDFRRYKYFAVRTKKTIA